MKNEDGVDMKVSAPLGTGNFFGELALMYNTKRAASIKVCISRLIESATVVNNVLKSCTGEHGLSVMED